MIALQISPKIESLYWVDKPQNHKDLYGILQTFECLPLEQSSTENS